MEKLMKPAEYAQEIGISRQAVYAKIKRGILTAKSVEGKLYIVVDKAVTKETTSSEKEAAAASRSVPSTKRTVSASQAEDADYKALLKAKDETISVLRGTVKDLKKSNKQISATLKGEIDLLKEAFYEMRTLYMHQLEQKKPRSSEEVIEVFSEEEGTEAEKDQWIGIKKFFKKHKISKEKAQAKTMKRLKKAYKSGDERIMMVEDKLKFNANKSYKDLLP
jgi:predicted site-specific integrase-resolvase